MCCRDTTLYEQDENYRQDSGYNHALAREGEHNMTPLRGAGRLGVPVRVPQLAGAREHPGRRLCKFFVSVRKRSQRLKKFFLIVV
jgi:hypothetical protein